MESSFRWRAPHGPLLPRPDKVARERWLALSLFVATAASVVVVHRWNAFDGWAESAAFAATLLGFLGAHEIAHRAVGRAHGMTVSLPLFLPAPFFVGTLGAVLRVHDRPRSRTALLEMGIAGPIAGWGVLVLATAARLAWSAPSGAGEALASPVLWRVASWAIRGGSAPLTTGDPVGYGIWVGCLITAMNLLPFGQLDGGHVMVALAPDRARLVTASVALGLAAAGFAWWGWWAWLVAIAVLARRSLTVIDSRAAPTPRARALALVGALVFATCFTPAPW